MESQRVGTARQSVMSAPASSLADQRRISKPELRALWMQQAGSRTRPGLSPHPDSGSERGRGESDVSGSSQGATGAGGGAGAGARDDAPQPGYDSWAVESPSDSAASLRGSDGGVDGGGGGYTAAGAGSEPAGGPSGGSDSPVPVVRCSSLAHAVGAFPDDLFEGEDGARGENQQVRDLFGFPAW